MCSLPDGHLYLLAVSLAFDAWELWWHIIGWETYLASARLVVGGPAVTSSRLPCRQEGGLVGLAACNTQCIFRVNMALAKANMPFLDTTSLCVYKEAPAVRRWSLVSSMPQAHPSLSGSITGWRLPLLWPAWFSMPLPYSNQTTLFLKNIHHGTIQHSTFLTYAVTNIYLILTNHILTY